MAIALVNARVLTDRGFETGRAVILEGGEIVDIGASAQGAREYDLQGRFLLPGFIDCQVNGGGGVLFNDDPSVETIRRIGAAHRAFGTTGFLPTLISDDIPVMRKAMRAVEEAIAEGVPGVLGIHLEGPFLAPERRGVHDAAKFHAPDQGEIDLVGSLKSGRTLLTLAPERVPSEVVRALAQAGVVVALGHTAARYAEVRAALDAGARGFTHLFNAMSPLQSREPGAVGAALEDRESWCGLIADGHHVHAAAMRVALAAKPKGKVFLVTDAMPPVGSSDTTFPLNGETVSCRDGRCVTPQGALAGSSLDMASAVRSAVEMLGVPLDEAVRMASTYPAAFLGIERTHGRIAIGCHADFVVMDDALTACETWIGGSTTP